MWKQLLKLLTGARTDPVPADSNAYYVYRVKLPEGFRDVVSLVPHDTVFASGLTEEAIIGDCTQLLHKNGRITDTNFRPNKPFVDLLHNVIATHALTLPGFQAEARRQHSGCLYVIDARTPAPAGEVPAYDIIGAFEVREGTVVPQSYQPNGNHRLFSSNGLFKLDPTLREKLMDRVIKQAQTSQRPPNPVLHQR
jgi:hypothetical protein